MDKPGVVPRFLFECAIKLQIKPLTSASAAIIFHRFFKEVSSSDYDEYVSRLIKKSFTTLHTYVHIYTPIIKFC